MKATAVAVVAPTVLVTAKNIFDGSGVNPYLADEIGKCQFTSFRYAGRTFHYKRYAHDVFETCKMPKQDVDTFLKGFGWAMPKPDGTMEYKKFK